MSRGKGWNIIMPNGQNLPLSLTKATFYSGHKRSFISCCSLCQSLTQFIKSMLAVLIYRPTPMKGGERTPGTRKMGSSASTAI